MLITKETQLKSNDIFCFFDESDEDKPCWCFYKKIDIERASYEYAKQGYKVTPFSIKDRYKNSEHIWGIELNSNQAGWLDANQTKIYKVTKAFKLLYLGNYDYKHIPTTD